MDNVDLLLDSHDPSFIKGFEMGRIWEILKSDWRLLDQHPIDAQHTELLTRMLVKLELTDLVMTRFSEDMKWIYLIDKTAIRKRKRGATR